MNDQAREALGQVIRTYGPSICNIPRSCEMFIRQACGAYPDESRALIEALRTGVTTDLVAYNPSDRPWDEFSGNLRQRLQGAGLAETQGDWAVDAWAKVLGRHPENFVPTPAPKPLVYPSDKPPQTDARIKVIMAAIVALGGGIGGFAGSTMVPAAVLLTSAATDMPLYREMNFRANEVWLAVTIILTILGSFGFIGGAVGGCGGWLFGRGENGHWNAFLTALGGAFVSSALGSYFCGIFGSSIGAFAGAFGASMKTASRGGLA